MGRAQKLPTAGSASHRRTGRRALGGTILVWALLMLIPAALIAGGAWLLVERTYGTRVQATVLTCDLEGGVVRGASTYNQDCTATWTIDGRAVIGGFTGGNGQSDVGRTVEATVRGDIAYSRALGLPILLLALGLAFLLIPAAALRGQRRRAERPRDPAPERVRPP